MKRILISLMVLTIAAAALAAGEKAGKARAISYPELSKLLAESTSDVLLVDVRTAEEYAAGRISGAVLFPYDEIGKRKGEFSNLAGKTDRRIVVYCRSGRRSAVAANTLVQLGYTNVADFGGIGNWKGKLVR